MKPNLIVTGACGFIGWNFVKNLLSKDCSEFDKIYLVDKMLKPSEINQDEFAELEHPQVIKYKMDVANLVPEENQSVVINFASESHVDNSIANPYQIFKDNSALIPNLIKAIGGVEKIKHFYHISTDEVFGHLTPDEVKSGKKFHHYDRINPRNPYSASKCAQENFLRSMRETFGLSLTIFRLANQFGKHQFWEKMIPASLERVFTKIPILIYGDGKNMREWTFVGYTVEVLSKMVLYGKTPEYFHIADNRNLRTNNQIVSILSSVLKDSYQLSVDVEYVEDRKGHDLCYSLESDVDFGGSFRDTIELTVSYYTGLRKCVR